MHVSDYLLRINCQEVDLVGAAMAILYQVSGKGMYYLHTDMGWCVNH